MVELTKKVQKNYEKMFKKEIIKEGILAAGLGLIGFVGGVDYLINLSSGNYYDEINTIRELISPAAFALGGSFSITSYLSFKENKEQLNRIKKGEQPINYMYFG